MSFLDPEGFPPSSMDAVQSLRVDLGERGYDIVVGPGALRQLEDLIPDSVRRVAVITQSGIPVEIGISKPHFVVEVPNGEEAKSLEQVSRLCSLLATEGFLRQDLILAVGGGVVTDLGGFVASVFHRGIRFINIPTTLLGMVDAAIGGKTGVNLPEGKNLVGSIWQPSAVIADTTTLETLPHREWLSGYGELAKYRFLGVEDLIDLPLVSQVSRSAALKAEVVETDEREGGRRALLNYGHTLAHAIEQQSFATENADIRHGEAVAIGLVFAARLAAALGRIDCHRVAQHIETVESYGLAFDLPSWVERERLVFQMLRDKKSDGTLTFVLDGEAGLEVVNQIDAEVVNEVLNGY